MPQLGSTSLDVRRILLDGLWYWIDDICGQRIISVRNESPCPGRLDELPRNLTLHRHVSMVQVPQESC